MMRILERLKKLLRGPGPGGDSGDGSGGPGDDASGGCRPITCREALEKLHEYLDGELEDVSHHEVAHHFAVCKECYPHLRFEEHFKDALRRSQRGELCPDHLRSQVLDLLATEAGDAES